MAAEVPAALDSINRQLSAAVSMLGDLATSQQQEGAICTTSLDRAGAAFGRLVAEVVDDQLAEMLPPLVTLRNELAQRAGEPGADAADDDLPRRGLELLDHVLALAGVRAFEGRPGEPCDPLIHLAVGEVRREDLPDGAVADSLQPGFRTARGKVIATARVRVNRRLDHGPTGD